MQQRRGFLEIHAADLRMPFPSVLADRQPMCRELIRTLLPCRLTPVLKKQRWFVQSRVGLHGALHKVGRSHREI